MTPPEIKPGDREARTVEIDRWRPLYYAAASGDFNPIHIDKEMAEMAGLGGVILQGLCTLSMACEVAVAQLGGDPAALQKVRVRFSKPVRPGDELTLVSTIKAVEGGVVQGELAATNQAGDEVLKHGTFSGAPVGR